MSELKTHTQVGKAIEDLDGPLRSFARAVHGLARREILRCLDPRHGTTGEQAEAAVYSVSPFLELAKFVGVK